MYSSTRTIETPGANCGASDSFPNGAGEGVWPCEILAVVADPDPLTSRELGTDRLARPNQCGKPCRRLNPPGGKRSSSVALTVSVSEEPVV